MEATSKVYVADVDEQADLLTEADLLTLEVSINIKNPRKRFAYAPRFPEFKTENWHILVSTPNGDVMFYKFVPSVQGENKHDFKLRLPKGKYDWEVQVKSDSYFGLDEILPLRFEILDGKLAQRDLNYHEEDQ